MTANNTIKVAISQRTIGLAVDGENVGLQSTQTGLGLALLSMLQENADDKGFIPLAFYGKSSNNNKEPHESLKAKVIEQLCDIAGKQRETEKPFSRSLVSGVYQAIQNHADASQFWTVEEDEVGIKRVKVTFSKALSMATTGKISERLTFRVKASTPNAKVKPDAQKARENLLKTITSVGEFIHQSKQPDIADDAPLFAQKKDKTLSKAGKDERDVIIANYLKVINEFNPEYITDKGKALIADKAA